MTYLQAILHRKVNLLIALAVILIIAISAAFAISAQAQGVISPFSGPIFSVIHCKTAAGIMVCYNVTTGSLIGSFNPLAILPLEFTGYFIRDYFTNATMLIIPKVRLLSASIRACAGGHMFGRGGLWVYFAPLHATIVVFPLAYGSSCPSGSL